MELEPESREEVARYYGEVLQTNKDLKTSVCCTAENLPLYLKSIADEIHPEVREKFYGCGSPIPNELWGRVVLDLGCGSGRDCFLVSKLVGPSGRAIGVDMTDAQLEIARKHLNYHTKQFGYTASNICFLRGYIEDLENLKIADGSVDVVISNCVINLSPSKRRVFSEIFRVLKPGGELHFSDVFTARRVPKALARDPILLGECLGGAMYIEDFRRMLRELGCLDYRIVSKAPLTIDDPEVASKVGAIDFYSMTVRAFKLELEDLCEDYGQLAYYLGTIPECPNTFRLDDHHLFEKNRAVPVCSNTAAMLGKTRFARHFRVVGDLSTHYGVFDCSQGPSQALHRLLQAQSPVCC